MAYLDGLDARIFNTLVERLGSEKRAQNAIILMGLLTKLGAEATGQSRRESQRKMGEIVREAFPESTGVSFAEFEKIISNIGDCG